MRDDNKTYQLSLAELQRAQERSRPDFKEEEVCCNYQCCIRSLGATARKAMCWNCSSFVGLKVD